MVVRIVQGSCDYRDGESLTNVSFSFRHDGVNTSGKVEMTIDGPTGTIVLSQKTEIELPPGTYTWTAESIDAAFELEGPDSGEFVVEGCAPEAEIVEVTVSVLPADCVWSDEQSLTGVTASISPDGGAIIVVDGTIQLTFDGQTVNVGPGDHTWTVIVAEPYKVVGNAEGTFATDACVPVVLSDVKTPETPVVTTPDVPVVNTPDTPVVKTPEKPSVASDTKVLGIQTTLPATGFDDGQTAVLALALILAGAGILLAVRKDDETVEVGTAMGRHRLGRPELRGGRR
ncbi:MAG: LPXTG cell wall anchor domain-containing protein [Acidimicrobiia bacterium]|nr:LPXTG cell wall anchor domain-containing protein [Acidimicrobiia bacterium]